MKDEEALMTPPPSLTPHQISRTEIALHHDNDRQTSSGIQPPLQRTMPEDDRNVVYQIMYSQSQHSETNYNRPVTPLQLCSDGSPPSVPVSCGNANGKMILNMFLCPGIHQPCIEMCGEILSPKQFTVRGDKERQKDWKASIRVGKSSLRTHMEAQTIDFFDHVNRCSGKCQSRNYVNAPVEREEVAQMRKAKRNSDVSILKNEIECEMTGKEIEEKKNNGKKARGRPRGSVNKPRVQVKIEPQDDQFFEEFFTDSTHQMVDQQGDNPTSSEQMGQHVNNDLMPQERFNGCSSFNDIMHCLQDEPYNFWTQMQQTGVISHFCDDIIVSALNLKQTAIEQPINPVVASMLTRSCFSLGVQNVVVHRVQSIERSVHQQRKHEEMIMEIQAKVAEDQRLKQMGQTSLEEDLHTAQEIEPDSVIDVVKFEDYSSTSGRQYVSDAIPPGDF